MGLARREGVGLPESDTVEGLFTQLDAQESSKFGDLLAREISDAISRRFTRTVAVAVFLINMAGERLGHAGDLSCWEVRGND